MPVLFRFHHCCLNSFLCLFLYFPPSASPVYFWHLVLNSLLKWVPPLLNAYFISHGAWMIQLGKKKVEDMNLYSNQLKEKMELR